MKENKKTQAQRLADKLSELRPDVTKEDRAAAATEKDMAPETISRYLNGKVNDNDTAVSLITFFKNRIERREKAIA